MDATVHRLPSFSASCCAAFCATAFGGITNNTVDRSSRNIGSGMDNGAVTTPAYDGAKSPILTYHEGSSEIFANLPAGANTTTYLYDLVGNIASVTEPNGVVTTYAYNSLSRLTDEVVKNADGTTLASYSYTLDNAGNRTGVTETQVLPNDTVNTRTVAYQYDNLYRLLSETISGDSRGGNGTVSYSYL